MNSKYFITHPDSNGNWVVKKNGGKQPISTHDTQYEAWNETRRLARGKDTSAILQGKNGKTITSNSYIDPKDNF